MPRPLPPEKITNQKSIYFIDICNTVADVCFLLEEKGHRVDVYPSLIPNPEEVFTEEFFRAARPIVPVINLVRELEIQGFSLAYLTARNPMMGSVTARWLQDHGLPMAPIFYANGTPKAEMVVSLAKGNGLMIAGVIEDSPQEVARYLELLPEMGVLMPLWGYNAHMARLPGVQPIETT